MTQKIKGYKVVLPTGKSKHGDFLFEVGKTYKHEGPIRLCGSGFHFSQRAVDCFNYYNFDSSNLVFEVEASGTFEHGGDKSVCSEISIIQQLSWPEVLSIVNMGKDNTGHSNTGDRNTGNWNTGDRNTGYSNTGNWNTGYSNTGNWNTGDRNTGNWNTGDRNTGNWNTGNWNTGNWNTGNWNTGNWNTGNWNTGDRNTGNWNTGDRNTGYSNTGDRNTGAFCASEPPFYLFDKECKMTHDEFVNSLAYRRLCDVDTKMWIPASMMTEEEKAAFPAYKTAEGYVRDIPFKEAFKAQWINWDETSRAAFTSLENFDKDIFFQITGVEI